MPHLPSDEPATARILELLRGVSHVDDGDPRKNGITTLEYRGQWQPKPNGAETGHGVIPKDWAIEVASDNDRALATFGWAGGAQLCLSNAFHEASKLESQAQDLIDSGTCTEDDAAVQCIRTIANSVEEREALMRRQWSDIDFQQGEEANREVVKHLERDFAMQLAGTASRQLSSQKSDSESDQWFNIKVASAPTSGKVYLSARLGGEGIELVGYDDESGRQRWLLDQRASSQEPVSGDITSTDSFDWSLIRVLGGTSHGRRLLSRGACGRLELCEHDDGSGRQRWRISYTAGDAFVCVCAAVGSGDPGIGAAAVVESEACGRCLGVDEEGCVVLAIASDDANKQSWLMTGPRGSACQKPPSDQEGDSGHSSLPNDSRSDGVLAIVVNSGTESAVGLKDLSQEQMTRVLSQNKNLGVAIDLVGVYLKNYEIDKADRLCSRIEKLCRERGGVWLFKLLNFYSTVRMKQSRYQEALDMYKEYETLVGYSADEAWELYDTVYRNFGWIYTSLHEYDKALEYFEKCVTVKRAHGVGAHWFDQWDLGKSHARLSLQRGKPENLDLALDMILQGLDMHRHCEPDDVIMRCKMLNSAGECAAIRGDFCSDMNQSNSWYDQAIELHQESYNLYLKVLGPKKPLTGWCMEDLAGALRRRGRYEEAKTLLVGALDVECSKDIIKLSSMVRLLDSVLDVHKVTSDRPGLANCQDAINTGLENLRRRRIDRSEGASYAVLLRKVAELLLEHDSANSELAVDLLEQGLDYLRPTTGSPASVASEPTEAPEPDRWLHNPQAGQQEVDVEPEELRAAIEAQLRQIHDAGFQQCKGASLHSSDRPKPKESPAELDEKLIVTCEQPQKPVHFEIVDDMESRP